MLKSGEEKLLSRTKNEGTKKIPPKKAKELKKDQAKG